MKTTKIDIRKILEMAEEFESLIPVESGFDNDFYNEAIVGITDDGRIVYSKDMMTAILSDRLLISYYDALEYLDYNCFCAYVGEKTPLYINQ